MRPGFGVEPASPVPVWEVIANRAGLFGLIMAGLVASRLLSNRAARPGGLESPGGRLAAARPLAWVRRRLPGQGGVGEAAS